MAAISSKVRGLNVLLVVFSLLVLGGSAYFMSTNTAVNYKSRASNSVQSLVGLLVKNGTSAFSVCGGVTTAYALVNSQFGSPCVALSVNPKSAMSLVGKNVSALGVYKDGIFYVTFLKLLKNVPNFKPRITPTPTPTSCMGLGPISACNPNATDPSQKCCAPYTCQNVYNGQTNTSSYICAGEVIAL